MSGVAAIAQAEKVDVRRPAGTVVDLGELRARLEGRLESSERELFDARINGKPLASAEEEWVRTLRRYERLCDLLAQRPGMAAAR